MNPLLFAMVDMVLQDNANFARTLRNVSRRSDKANWRRDAHASVVGHRQRLGAWRSLWGVL